MKRTPSRRGAPSSPSGPEWDTRGAGGCALSAEPWTLPLVGTLTVGACEVAQHGQEGERSASVPARASPLEQVPLALELPLRVWTSVIYTHACQYVSLESPQPGPRGTPPLRQAPLPQPTSVQGGCGLTWPV